MSDQIQIVVQVVGVVVTLLGAIMLGMVVGKLEKDRAVDVDSTPDASLAGAAAALCGAGTLLLSTSWF